VITLPPMLERLRTQGDTVLAGVAVALLAIVIVPLPPFILDMLLACSIGSAVLMFLAVLMARRPVELSVFPTILLGSTVYRLGLDIATTRRILLDGAGSSAAGGYIIEAFGQFVVGGNAIVGLVVFVILVVINFVVITKGAGRVAEVAARFTLDALPGKQMAIDAEMNAGLIDEKVARRRRADIAREAEFYGAMDGASKFIRGDAIAGIVVVAVNCIGGTLIGTIQYGMPLADVVNNFIILTIGEGLVAQIPALIVSMAAGLLVTRVTDTDERALHTQVRDQFTEQRLLALTAGTMACFAVIPGMRIPFGLLALGLGGAAWARRDAPATPAEVLDADPVAAPQSGPEDLLPVDPLVLEVGLDLLYLVDRPGGELVQRIQRIRSQVAQDLGLVLPPVHIRDNLRLEPGEYAILLRGDEIGRGRAYARQHMALDPGGTAGPLTGIPTTDPVFGLPAFWIGDGLVFRAQALGYTVVDVPTVLTTHLVELLHVHGHELFDGAQLAKALDRVRVDNVRLVDDLIPDPMSRAAVLRVFRNLLREGVSVRDTQTVLEALSDYAGKTKDPDVLTEFVRQRLARHVTRRFGGPEGVLRYVGFTPEAEDVLLRGLQTPEGGSPTLVLEPEIARRVFARVRELTEGWSGGGQVVVLCPPLARGALRRMLERGLPRVPVISSAEILPTVRLERVGLIDMKAPPPPKGLKSSPTDPKARQEERA
jgi:flagellar biosynthesis protein FlhA